MQTRGVITDFWCIACGSYGGADVTLNVALFVPLGVALVAVRLGPIRAVMLAAFASMAVEASQRYGFPPSRVASVSDIISNTSGALIGVLLACNWRILLMPSRRNAAILTVVGGVTACALLSFTAWALGRDTNPPELPPLRVSPMRFTPSYGWYHGHIEDVSVNDAEFPHAGDGPVILRGQLADTTHIQVHVAGRDERIELLPLLYVEAVQPEPLLLLGQEGTSAHLQVRLRGSRLRLPGPTATLPEVFTGNADQRILRADISSRQWQLDAAVDGSDHSMMLPISLSLGWTLFQTVLHTNSPGHRVAEIGWLLLCWLPVGYWCMLAASTRQFASANNLQNSGVRAAPSWRWSPFLVGGTFLVLSLGLVPFVADISPSSIGEWLSAAVGIGAGVLFAWRVLPPILVDVGKQPNTERSPFSR